MADPARSPRALQAGLKCEKGSWRGSIFAGPFFLAMTGAILYKPGAMTQAITGCRICGAHELEAVLNLGEQCLTGVFPSSPTQALARAPLELVKCAQCGLVQLHHNFEPSALYGTSYGYRSGLNPTMVAHLRRKAEALQALCPLHPGDAILDIGSNDGTSLGFYPSQGVDLIGFDPSAEKLRKFYKPEAQLRVDFFSAAAFRHEFGAKRPKIISSIAMFYDLQSPPAFVADVRDILAPNGVWHFEQSYLPLMLQANAYDTICHEHLEYYALKQVKSLTDHADLKIIDVQLNDVNGGSFAITAAHQSSPYPEASDAVNRLLRQEKDLGLDGLAIYQQFRDRVFNHRDHLAARLREINRGGQLALGYGASTKGNVVLQFCAITPDLLPAILEVNPDKFGCYTPGTAIPIIPEPEGHARKPDFLLVLPWHFKANIVQREAVYLQRGGKLLFPLPEIHTV